MQDLLIKDEKALKAIMIAGMIWKRMNKQLGMKWKPSLPPLLHLHLWTHLFVNCGMDAKEADDWIDQRLTRWWRQLKWQIPLVLLTVQFFACLTGALSWLHAPVYLTGPLALGQILTLMAVFPFRGMFFVECIGEHDSNLDWCLLLEKCRGAFPYRISFRLMALMLGFLGFTLLMVFLVGRLIALVFGI